MGRHIHILMLMPEPRDTPVTFTGEEAARVREIIADPERDPACPLCGGELVVGDPVAAGGTVQPIWEIRCASCHKSAYASRVAGSHRRRRRP